jgi:hypothetical protein
LHSANMVSSRDLEELVSSLDKLWLKCGDQELGGL